jgi:S1-C subfamily serine protease
MKGEWVKSDPKEKPEARGPGAFTGITFVPRVVDRTPAYIEEVAPNSPAAKAGLQPDDLVIYFDGEPVYSLDTFGDLLKRYVPGDKVQIEVRRGERLTSVQLELAPLPKK